MFNGRRPRALIASGVCALAGAVTGCVNYPTHPVALDVPTPNRTDWFPNQTVSTRELDCISQEIHRYRAQGPYFLLYITPMPNNAGPKVGKVDLPTGLQPFARAAFDRITSGFRVVSGEKVPTNLRLNGGIYFGSPFRVIDDEAEVAGFGVGSHVEATDIGIQVYFEAGSLMEQPTEQSGTSVSMTLRLYYTEQGASAFRVAGTNGLILAHSEAIQGATPAPAIQEAVNLAVATLVENMAARAWHVTSACDVGARTKPVITSEGDLPSPAALVDVQLQSNDSEVCAVLRPRAPLEANRANNGLVMEVVERRGEGILIRSRTTRVASLNQLASKKLCLPRSAFDERVERITMVFKTADGSRLGGADLFL